MRSKGETKRIGVFVFFDGKGEVHDCVECYVAALRPFFSRLLIVVNGELDERGREVFQKYTGEILVRENIGYDVAAFQAGIERIGYKALESYDELILLNDSVYGPLFPLNELFETMGNREDLDLWGISGHRKIADQSYESNPCGCIEAHIQSYFTAFRNSVLCSDSFKEYWTALPIVKNKNEAIGRHETYMTYYFASRGFKWGTYLPINEAPDSPEDVMRCTPIKAIREYRCPVLKRFLFSTGRGYGFTPAGEIFQCVKSDTQYDTELIRSDAIHKLSMEELWDLIEAKPHIIYLNDEITHLQTRYGAKCAEYESALQSQRDQLKQQSAVLAQQQAQAAQLQALYDEKCREYDKKCGEYDKKCGEYDKKCGEYDKKCGEYDKKCREYLQKCRDYDEIANAFFWRATKPLRRVMDALKKVFRNNSLAKWAWQKLSLLRNKTPVFEEQACSGGLFYRPGDSMKLLCTKHTLFVAELVKNTLRKVGIQAEIMTSESEHYGEEVHIVICPQMFQKMPGRYIAFQMEQTVSSRWLTDDYFRMLSHAHSIFDYSLVNIDYFKKTTEFGKNFYYLPIDYLPGYRRDADAYDYDVAFYGDVNNPRRKQMLEKLQEHFSVKIISEVFGEELYDQLSRAKIVVNIHYYENAMLETTRLYETLSLGRSIVVSERSTDPEEEKRLEGIVDFVEIGDTNAMIERIGYWLSHEQEFADKVAQNNALLDERSSAFDYFFLRFLLANDWLSFDRFYELSGDFVHFDGNRICLSLPEAVDRRAEFDRDNRFGFQVIPGLRHRRGWTGCGLSYKFIMKKAQEQRMKDILVCEDDVLFPEDFEQRFERCLHYLSEHPDWDIFQGLMADVGKVTVSCVEHECDQTFVHLDHMISMVFNYYRSDIYQSIINWDETNDDVQKNTIDRALEAKDLKIVATAPFLVGHKEELDSTVWGFNNTQYSDMIAKSSEKLERLAREFEKEH